MSYEKDLIKYLKENAFKDQGYELIHDDIYGKSGVYLTNNPRKENIISIVVPEDMQSLDAYKSFVNLNTGHEVVSDECGKFFMFDDGSVLFVKNVPDGDDEYYLYKEVYFDKDFKPVHLEEASSIEDENDNINSGVSEEQPKENQTFINLTPHPINLNGTTILPESQPARCTTSTKVVDTIDGVEIRKKTFGEVYGLPEPVEGKYYIVSSIVAQALGGTRDDILITDGAIRDESGRVIGCTGLARL